MFRVFSPQEGRRRGILPFEPGRVSLASDLLEKTEEGLELFARQGDMMGTAAT